MTARNHNPKGYKRGRWKSEMVRTEAICPICRKRHEVNVDKQDCVTPRVFCRSCKWAQDAFAYAEGV